MAKLNKSGTLYTRGEVVESLRLAKGAKDWQEFATEIGISPQLMSMVLSGKRPLHENMLRFLGLEDVGKMYRRVGKVGR